MKLSSEERKQGRLSHQSLSSIVNQVRVNGYSVIEEFYEKDTIRQWHEAYLKLFQPFVEKTRTTNSNGHYRMDLPFEAPFVEEELVAHPMVLQVMEALLGEDCICQYLASNTCLPGSGYQDIHSDLHPLYPEADITLPPAAIVLNIALVDFREDNGPTEIWPGGTHLIPESMNRPELITETAQRMESIHITMPAGSISMRDLRMWHRGVPNHSNEPRPMISIVYFRHWFGAEPLCIPKERYEGFAPSVKRLFRKAMFIES